MHHTVTVTVTVTDCLLKHELQKSSHPSPVVSRHLFRAPLHEVLHMIMIKIKHYYCKSHIYSRTLLLNPLVTARPTFCGERTRPRRLRKE
jgi:hypothetical protein